MPEKFRFFDPVETSPGVFDREYNAQEFTEYFATLINTGLMKGFGSELEVSATGSNMETSIASGIAFISGRYYESTGVTHEHDLESIGVNRIDRIVVRLDNRTEARHVLSFIKKGVPAVSPVAPALTRNNDVYEISLAQVYVTGGQSFIEQSNITDERGDETLCPYASSNILPNIEAQDFVELENAFNAHKADYEYQEATVVSRQIRLTRQSNTNRLVFRLNTAIGVGTGITISLDGGSTSKPLRDIDGTTAITELAIGFYEVIADATFFILKPSGGSNIKSIQRGNSIVQGAVQSVNVTINGVDLTKSIILINISASSTDIPTSAGYFIISAHFLNSTTLVLTRGQFAGGVVVNWQVIEFNNVKSIQTGLRVVSSAANTEDIVTISTIDPQKSFIFASAWTTYFTSPIIADTLSNSYYIKSPTQISFVRPTTTATLAYRWQVIEFK